MNISGLKYISCVDPFFGRPTPWIILIILWRNQFYYSMAASAKGVALEGLIWRAFHHQFVHEIDMLGQGLIFQIGACGELCCSLVYNENIRSQIHFLRGSFFRPPDPLDNLYYSVEKSIPIILWRPQQKE